MIFLRVLNSWDIDLINWDLSWVLSFNYAFSIMAVISEITTIAHLLLSN